MPSRTKDWSSLKCEAIDITVRKTTGTFQYSEIPFPEVYGQVMDFYLEDTHPIFFPTYEHF
jgi:hypothetical protein